LSEVSLVVGLGNPTSQYEKTRHNAGFWFLDLLAKQQSKPFESVSRFQAEMFSADWSGIKVLFLKPMTYMNNSGHSVGAVARYYRVPPEKVLVVHDDLDFDAGTIRLKRGGGHGGHNGVRDVIDCLGSKAFVRLRIGVGRPMDRQSVLSYVLTRPSLAEKEAITSVLQSAADQCGQIISGELGEVMNQLHGLGAKN